MRGNIHAFIKLFITHQGAVRSQRSQCLFFWDGQLLEFQKSLAENPNLNTHPQPPLVSFESQSHILESFSHESRLQSLYQNPSGRTGLGLFMHVARDDCTTHSQKCTQYILFEIFSEHGSPTVCEIRASAEDIPSLHFGSTLSKNVWKSMYTKIWNQNCRKVGNKHSRKPEVTAMVAAVQ